MGAPGRDADLIPSKGAAPRFSLIHQHSPHFANFHTKGDLAIIRRELEIISPRQGVSGEEGGKDEMKLGMG